MQAAASDDRDNFKGRILPRAEWPEQYLKPIMPAMGSLIPFTGYDPDVPPFYVPPPRRWRLLLVHPRQEKRAMEKLHKARLWAYWPNFERLVCHRMGGRRPILSAVLPGYMLLAEHPARDDTWRIVHAAVEIYGYVSTSSGAPAVMCEEQVEFIREIEARLAYPPTPDVHGFTVGEQVTFKDDLFWQWKGPILALADDGRISVEVDMLGCKVPIWTTSAQIERCS